MSTSERSDTPPRPLVEMPKRMSVVQAGSRFTLIYRWLSIQHFIALAFCIVWNGFLLDWYEEVTLDDFATFDLMAYFPLLHVAVGIALAYYALSGFVNRTRIVVTRSEITVRNGPLPWLGNRTLPSGEVDQLYIRERTGRGADGGSRTTYRVHVRTKSGYEKPLVTGLSTREQARYIEQEIERYLEIPDQRVAGEIL